MTNEELGKHLARALFKVGDGPHPCTRIQFMSGDYRTGTEQGQGGFAEEALARHLSEVLNEPPALKPEPESICPCHRDGIHRPEKYTTGVHCRCVAIHDPACPSRRGATCNCWVFAGTAENRASD